MAILARDAHVEDRVERRILGIGEPDLALEVNDLTTDDPIAVLHVIADDLALDIAHGEPAQSVGLVDDDPSATGGQSARREAVVIGTADPEADVVLFWEVIGDAELPMDLQDAIGLVGPRTALIGDDPILRVIIDERTIISPGEFGRISAR